MTEKNKEIKEPTKEELQGLDWIRDRAEQHINTWTELKFEQLEIASAYADLENDFNFVKGTNTHLSYQWEYLIKILPTRKEVEFLIEKLGELYNNTTVDVDDRLENLKKFQLACQKIEDRYGSKIITAYDEENLDT